MPYQNRVDPLGQIHAVPQRGLWFGNRGCLHDAGGKIRRAHQVRRWITCVTDFKGRRRTLVQPGRYTELFFFDEATAYAAGHRPCAECRHADWLRFRALWEAEYGERRADEIDARLDVARRHGRARRLVAVASETVPKGAMVLHEGVPVLRAGSGWWRWSFDGYTPAPAPDARVSLLTPAPLARLMALGLPVQISLSE
ncbi:hypothetical protein [Pararhodobacter zhoushanensis]|uniref:Metal binding domain of Ada n=1 Tax=Pararhodobacter zhoushanensis TaxID=2479545 RepID=A0ABT3H123_9RHOB|nr:hypothetical protein [Pararhodobacter zhoushanensis]MCW1933486.1 hypothetical protein [Pararhodobacter zhoushanensis]